MNPSPELGFAALDKPMGEFGGKDAGEDQRRAEKRQIVRVEASHDERACGARCRNREVNRGSVERQEDRRECRGDADQPVLLRNDEGPAANPP